MAEQAQNERFIAALSKFGGFAGNGKLRASLGWDEVTYSDVRQALIAVGIIVPGRGRGGSVRLLPASGSSSETDESGQETQPHAAESASSRGRKGSGNGNGIEVADYRHDDTRKNIPPAKIAAEGRIPAVPKITYSYSPRLDPTIRFDDSAGVIHSRSCWRRRGSGRLLKKKHALWLKRSAPTSLGSNGQESARPRRSRSTPWRCTSMSALVPRQF